MVKSASPVARTVSLRIWRRCYRLRGFEVNQIGYPVMSGNMRRFQTPQARRATYRSLDSVLICSSKLHYPIFGSVLQSQSSLRSAFCLLQLLPDTQEFAGDASYGGRAYRSRLVAARTAGVDIAVAEKTTNMGHCEHL